jgi:DNA-binding MarR family transcriptional regulator
MSANSKAGDPDLLRLIWEASHALQAMSRHMERKIGITGPQRLVMREVGQRPDILPGELATALGIHASTVTGIVERLVERGLVERERSPDDRRSTRLRLTPAGRVLLDARAVTIESVVTASTATMTPRARRDAAEFLHTVAAALREAAEDDLG